MNTLRMLAAAAALAGLCGCNLAAPAAPPPSRIGTRQLVATSDGVVWKLNTETGETRRCLDGMVEKACVLANDVDSVAQLRPNPATSPAPSEPVAQADTPLSGTTPADAAPAGDIGATAPPDR
ncbi:hypothetical protein [Cognatilysobacter segetis]|uniref:hypothetical protein n=1 Tax=Cognatilysobacter segetis TaxID=2492394 RepID=UPI00105C3BDA|nr:hypothetical protein [Lysobacter segetis]